MNNEATPEKRATAERCAVASGSDLPWWVIDTNMRRKMAGPYRLEETADAVRNFMAGLRSYELHTLEICEHPDTGNPWMPDDQNTEIRHEPLSC